MKTLQSISVTLLATVFVLSTYFLLTVSAYAQTTTSTPIADPTCSITYVPGTTPNTIVLTWTSTNAIFASITGIGSVSADGTRTVATGQYTMSAWNSQGKTAVCDLTQGSTIVVPATPAVSSTPTHIPNVTVELNDITNGNVIALSQVPYTGFGDVAAIGVYLALIVSLGYALKRNAFGIQNRFRV